MKKQENIPERISASGRKLPFKVPESYFEEFPGRLLERLENTETPVIRPDFFRSKLAVAAMFIGLLAIGYAGMRIIVNGSNSPYLSDEEFLETIEFFVYDLDNGTLASAVIESDINLDFGTFDSRTEELIQYLSEEDIDIDELLIDY